MQESSMLDIFQIIVVLQQLIFTVAYIPQIYRLLKEDTSDSISPLYYIARLCALMLLEVSYCMLHSWILIITNLGSIVPEIIILFLVIIKNSDFQKQNDKEIHGY